MLVPVVVGNRGQLAPFLALFDGGAVDAKRLSHLVHREQALSAQPAEAGLQAVGLADLPYHPGRELVAYGWL